MPLVHCIKKPPEQTFSHKKQKGFSLIEVLVSLVLVSFGLMTLTNHQMQSLSVSTAAYTETQGTLHLQEIVELLRVNKDAAASGNYNIALSSFSDLPTEELNSAETERFNWFKNLNSILPGAEASISCSNSFNCKLSLEHDLKGKVQKQSIVVIL